MGGAHESTQATASSRPGFQGPGAAAAMLSLRASAAHSQLSCLPQWCRLMIHRGCTGRRRHCKLQWEAGTAQSCISQ